jgi:hypothetical protein
MRGETWHETGSEISQQTGNPKTAPLLKKLLQLLLIKA